MYGMLIGMALLSTKGAIWVNQMRRQLFPPGCLFCHAPLQQDGCCQVCLAGIRPLTGPACGRCGSSMPESLAPGPCGRCLLRPPAQQSTRSLYAYQDAVRTALLAWKLQGDDAAMRWLLSAAAVYIQGLIGPEALLLPVPMPLSRMRRRGQHHGADLCRQIAAISRSQWEWRLLRRRGEQPRQSELSGRARLHNLRRAFVCDERYCRQARIEGRPIWVIDDIITTGATVHHAARALQLVGLQVHVLSLARTLPKG